MEIHPSALRHGVSEDSIRHAISRSITYTPLDEDPPRILILGPDTAGNLLEVIAIVREEDLLPIHAMKMRDQYRHLLPR